MSPSPATKSSSRWSSRKRRKNSQRIPSIAQPLHRRPKLFLGLLGVESGGVEILMSQDLGQAHEVISIVQKELVGHRVTQQVRVQLDAQNGTVLAAQGPDAAIRTRATLTDENTVR